MTRQEPQEQQVVEPQPGEPQPVEPQPERFGDEGAGPEESDEVVNDPENQAAAKEIRDSTIEPADEPGQAPELAEPIDEDAPPAPIEDE